MWKKVSACTASLVAGICLSFGVAPADHHEAKTSDADQHFMMEAAQGGMAEVALGQMAAEKAASEDVKKFGQRMVTDHGKANQELMQLAGTKGVTLPKETNATHKSVSDRLSKLSGAEFDRAYMQEMLKDHNKDIAAFEQQAEQGKDQELKSWATKILPTLKEHKEIAQTTAEKVGAKSAAKDQQ